MRSLLMFLICLLSISTMRCDGQVHYKVWDTNAPVIRRSLTTLIPPVYLKQGKSVMIETVPSAEFLQGMILLYPKLNVTANDVSEISGWYIPRPKDCPTKYSPEIGSQILLNNVFDVKYINEHDVVCHEYGHFVWFEMLSENERDKFFSMWFNECNYDKTLPSDYAYDSCDEGFSECFVSWCRKDNLLSKQMKNFFIDLEKRLHKSMKRDPQLQPTPSPAPPIVTPKS